MAGPYRADQLLALDDYALARHAYTLVGSVESSTVADEFYFLLTEIFERFAPHAERAELERSYAHVADRDREIASALDALRSRSVLRDIEARLRSTGESRAA